MLTYMHTCIHDVRARSSPTCTYTKRNSRVYFNYTFTRLF